MIYLFLLRLLLWFMIVFGVTQIIVEATIFNIVRHQLSRIPILGELVSCFLCVSVWVGFLSSTFIWSPSSTLFPVDYIGNLEIWILVFVDGMIASTGAWFMHVIEVKLSRK